MKTLLLYLHIAGGLALTGELLMGTLWLRSAVARGGGPAILRYALGTMAWTGRSIALPAMLVNLVAGLGLLHLGGAAMMKGKWVIGSVVLYVILMGLWHGMLIPTRKKMQVLIEGAPAAGYAAEERETSSEFLGLAKRWLAISAVAVVILFAILFLMVWRPL